MAKATSRFAVLPLGYDDIGAVLRSMGSGFEYTELSWRDLERERLPDGCEVIFINCSDEATVNAGSATRTIGNFVARGGSLYASDFAGSVIEATFPNLIEFDQDTESDVVECDVTDPGLSELIGPRISISFDLPGWWRMTHTSPKVRIYLCHDDGEDTYPVVAGFAHGKGHVTFTSFHNHAQTSSAERQLLQFLALRPILARAADLAQKTVASQAFTPGKEIIATVNRDSQSPVYVYDTKGAEELICLLQWEGAGSLGLTVKDPAGATVQQSQADRPPLQFRIPNASPGRWSFTVHGVNIPHANFPYVFTLGARPAGAAAPPAPAAGSKTLRPLPAPVGTYRRPWNRTFPGCLIILVDLSGSMATQFVDKRAGQRRSKAEAVATMINGMINELIRANTAGAEVRSRADIAVLGYEGVTARSLLGGKLAGRGLVSLADLAANPLRIEIRVQREIDDEGNVVEIPLHFPQWIEPYVGTTTPMCAALQQASELAHAWAATHQEHFPPVVVNITDGASTDGDPTDIAHTIAQIRTADGAALIFNCHISELAVPPLHFPSHESQVPQDVDRLAPLLYALSSPIPDTLRNAFGGTTGHQIGQGARGFIFNGDAASVRQMFVFATVAATQPLDPNR